MSPVPFELQPRLLGPRLELRPLTRDDFHALYGAASDPGIWEQHPEPDRHTPEVFRAYFDSGIASGGALAIVDRVSRRVIGSSRYCNLDAEAGEVEIGWTFLERAYWGGATNAELKGLMLDHAFLFVERVVFVVGADNRRSRKALEKIGARLIRSFEKPDRDGTPRAHVVFAIDRAEHVARAVTP